MFRLQKPSQELIDKIESKLIEPVYYNDVKRSVREKAIFKFVGDISETLSQIALGISSVFAFSAGFFNMNILAFVAGCLGTMAIVLSKFSSYALKESKERTEQVNIILTQLGIEKIPDIVVNSTEPVQIKGVVNSNETIEV